ncbi:MAG TPA: membrane protein insertase YidC [Longimicrobiaceae bacterium]|jgi:YidC/Oxa1 family membrane protein insertase|nr:membrane protein insertase YidC [Longimicrobiaceae bacterium]
MEKRILLALVMAMGVMLATNWLFPPKRPVADAPPAAVAAAAARATNAGPAQAMPAVPAQTVTVTSPLYRYGFSTRGGALVEARLLKYASYVNKGQPVQLVPEGALDVLAHRVALGGDTVDLRGAPFTASAASLDLKPAGGPQELRFTYAPQGGVGAEIVYTFRPDSYVVGIRGRLLGVTGRAALLTDLGPGLAHHDAREHGSAQELAVAGWNSTASKLDDRLLHKVEGTDTIGGPLAWAAVKDRYFLIALIPAGAERFDRVLLRDTADFIVQPPTGSSDKPEVFPRANATAVLPLPADGAFAFEAYLGPQEYSRVAAVGHDLDEVNPYGYRWLRPVVRPIAAFLLWVVNEAHQRWGLAYGWILVLAGIAMRVITWPLNARAMRAQMKNMEMQPILQARTKELQDRYKNDPAKQQQEMFALYKELGVSPFSMLSGCLPMLVPMPVLITLFFVFRSAIEFRGTSFWWLPDLSLADPWHVLPIFLVLSMFALQWVSTRMSGMEQNPQAQTMMYIMPLMMGFLFFRFPSGLNLYYATTNLASLPQQLLIARERKKASAAKKAEEAASKPPSRGSPGGKTGAHRVKPRR